jgi:glycosyltransferase involved in cell wall biosynthesis
MPRFYSSIDALLHCSRTESQGRVVLEAMLAGVLVLAPAISGVVDFVIHRHTGIIIDPDDPFSMRSELEWLTNHPEHDTWVRAHARSLAVDSVNEAIVSWQHLLGSLLPDRKKQRS